MDVMTETILRRTLLTLIVIIFCGVVFHAPASVWLGTILQDYQQIIKSWKELLLLLALGVTIVQVSRHHLWRELLSDWVIRLSLAYVTVHLLLLPFMWQGLMPAMAGLMIDLRFVVFFVVVYTACKLYPFWRRPLLWGGFVAAALAMLFVVLQLVVLPRDFLVHLGYGENTIAPYMTVDQNDDYVRINGTLRGPNPLGAYGVIVASLCLAVLVATRKKLVKSRFFGDIWDIGAVGLVALAAVWFSYSRAALVALALAIGIILIIRYGKRVSRTVWVAIGLSALLLVGGVYVARDTHFVSHVILHEDPDEGNNVNSNDQHWDSLIEGVDRVARQPLGAGIGSTGSPSLIESEGFIIENYYLYVAHEAGWAGLALFVALFAVVMRRLWRYRHDWLALGVLASGAGLMIASLVLPVWADDTVSVVWWGLAAIALATGQPKNKGVKHE